ncbi:MAG TPA: chemotaxis protein CheW [Gemmatimonadaceae bacterium]|nr:chemotaxis protein CheW [Gemmatimonadaceae bacterium]
MKKRSSSKAHAPGKKTARSAPAAEVAVATGVLSLAEEPVPDAPDTDSIAVHMPPPAADQTEPGASSAWRDPRPFRDRVRSRTGEVDLLLFRVGAELFAAELRAVEEAVEWPAIHPLPEARGALLGAFEHRGRMTALYTPARALGHPEAANVPVAMVARIGERRIGLAVADVEDVMTLALDGLREAPVLGDADGVLLGVARCGHDLVALVDIEALIAACLFEREMETA